MKQRWWIGCDSNCAT